MVVQGVATIAVVGVSPPARITDRRIAVYRLAQALEASEKGWHREAEVDEYLVLLAGVAVLVDEDGSKLPIGVLRQTVRQKALLAEGPKQVVEVACLLAVRQVDEYPVSLAVDALYKTAREQEAVAAAVLVKRVEIDACHFISPLRLSRNSVSRDTGRPVDPFCLPLSHATPAMSKCAQGYFFVNRARKQAAVIAPP